jgi:hypothetical protein
MGKKEFRQGYLSRFLERMFSGSFWNMVRMLKGAAGKVTENHPCGCVLTAEHDPQKHVWVYTLDYSKCQQRDSVTHGGYVERCLVREKTSKGEQHFLNAIKECARIILEQLQQLSPQEPVTVKYRGDFAKELNAIFQELKAKGEEFKSLPAHKT